MWMILGLCAIASAILNLVFWFRRKDPKWFRFLSMSLTAMTLCASYSMDAQWVLKEDWSALSDVVPTMSQYFWYLVGTSIGINGITLFPKK